MLELVKAGGWLMWPIIACSVIAMAIIVDRLWAYRKRKVLPSNLVAQIWQLHQNKQLTAAHIATVRNGSQLGRILAAGLVNGLGRLSLQSAEGLKLGVSGQLQSYVLTVVVAIVLLFSALSWLARGVA